MISTMLPYMSKYGVASPTLEPIPRVHFGIISCQCLDRSPSHRCYQVEISDQIPLPVHETSGSLARQNSANTLILTQSISDNSKTSSEQLTLRKVHDVMHNMDAHRSWARYEAPTNTN